MTSREVGCLRAGRRVQHDRVRGHRRAAVPDRQPALTAPFVLVTWLLLLPKTGFQTLQPVALADVSTAKNTRASYRVRGTGPGAAPQPGEAT